MRPILSQSCFACHGLDEPKSDLRLDFAEFAYEGGKSGRSAIVPGKPEQSEVILRVTAHGEDRMPAKGDALTPGQVSLLKQWINEGARYANHWAYEKPVRPAVAREKERPFIRNPIDSFVLKGLDARGWKPSEPADKARWLRRVSLGLIGLPPTIEEIEAFLGDDSPEAREKVVDRLLASPRYGEHWARQWLDLARYADSNGFQADQLRDSWAFRDWVIEAMNADMPFDQFTIEQLAGDLLPKATVSQKIATGFHRTPTCNVEAGVHPEENRVNQVVDRVNATGLTWLGTTLECAQCHSHKYDPFSQEEYYKLFAFFNNTPLEVQNKSGKGVSFDFWGPKMELPLGTLEEEEFARLDSELVSLKGQLKAAQKEADTEFPEWIKERAGESVEKETQVADWKVAPIESASSDAKETFELLEDGSALAMGKSGDRSTYLLQARAGSGKWKALRLEALLHESLKKKGPGRNVTNANPNFVLTEFLVFHGKGDQRKPVALKRARAGFSQSSFKAEQLIDGKLDPKNGWAIAPRFGERHEVHFEFKETLDLKKPAVLEIEMKHFYGGGRNVGRPRLSLSGVFPPEQKKNDRLYALIGKKKRTKKEEKELKELFLSEKQEIVSLGKTIGKAEGLLSKIKPATTLVMVEMNETRETHVMARGNYLTPKQKVDADVPESLHAWNDDWPRNRLGLAKWLVHPDNPLVARVTVNRWWGQFFGTGIVSTEADFGSQSEPPTHPELLDWLAVEFMENGWSMKHIHKLIALSGTYGQSSNVTPSMLDQDPNNLFFMRGPRLRMSAEMIRDNALRVSGLLSKKMAGPPIYPPQPDGLWRQTGRNEPKYVAAKNEDRFRRGIYVIWRRAAPYASFVNFDGPDRSSCFPKRSRTNTPLQALTLLNDQAYVEMALGFAASIIQEKSVSGDKEGARWAFRRTLAREPTEREVAVLEGLLQKERKRLQANPKDAKALVGTASALKLSPGLDEVELASWFFVANALLNLDETITKG
ncbi:MAG: DUF1553 domain-containing protein [Opitutae bacterium]|nr:DUF1553 domain-containing protein [Opitutae bacterium]